MVSSYTGSIFSPQEYQRRLKATQVAIGERGADLALIHQPEHIYYLTGFPGPGAGFGINQVCIVPVDGDPVLVIRRMEEQPMLATSWVKEYAMWSDFETTTGVLKKEMQRRGFADKTIAVEYDSWALTHARFNKIKEALSQATFVDFSRVLWYQRQRKSQEEINYLQQAADICVKAMKRGIEAIEPGRTEREISNVIQEVFDDEEADSGNSGLILTSGDNLRFVHAGPSKRPLQKGDIIHIELSPSIQNYHSRIMRAVVIGEPTDRQKRVAQVVEEAQSEAIALMRPGAVARDVDRACREKIEKAGVRGDWETPYYNVTGYTLGIIFSPWVSDFSRCFLPNEDWVLEEGSVYHMYTFAQGISFSETVHVTAKGPGLLTRAMPRKLSIR
ncbi:MAG: Xaa-Pro peptidase family protein [Dehalococcoidia bacterium]